MQGRGLSRLALRAMTAIARAHGLGALIAPVRPNWKERYPLAPIDRCSWRRPDGLLFDPWLQVHERLGAVVLKPEPHSLRITGTVGEWEVDGAGVPGERRLRLPAGARDAGGRSRRRRRPVLGAERVDAARRVSERPLAAAALAALVVGVVGVAAADSADAPPSAVVSPRSGEAFFGVVRVTAPAGATRVEAPRPRRRSRRRAPVRRGTALFRLPAGRYDLAVRVLEGASVIAKASAKRVWSLPNDARRALAPPTSATRRLSAALGAAGGAFPGYAAV